VKTAVKLITHAMTGVPVVGQLPPPVELVRQLINFTSKWGGEMVVVRWGEGKEARKEAREGSKEERRRRKHTLPHRTILTPIDP
jgi:hypothetical protein